MPLLLHPASRNGPVVRFHWYDFVVALVTPALAFWLRDDSFFFRGDNFISMLVYSGIAFVSTIASLQYFRVSDILTSYFSAHDAVRIIKAAVATVVLTASIGFTVTRLDTVPRSIPMIHLLLLTGSLAVGRFGLAYYKQRRPAVRNQPTPSSAMETILVVGANRLAWFYIRMVDSFTRGHQRVVAILDPNPKLHGRSLAGHSIIGAPSQLGNIIDEYAVHGVIVTRVMMAGAKGEFIPDLWDRLFEECETRQVAIGSIPDQLGLSFPHEAPALQDADTYTSRSAYVHMENRFIWKIKRMVDLVFVLSTGLLFLPIMGLIAFYILIDSGMPVVFWQERLGRGGAPVFVYKFRTLKAPFDSYGRPVPEDDRYSRLGRFLRATRIDELPQLYNILMGDMSLIGPRPLLPIDQPDGRSTRLSVRPGITGWAQVHGGKLVGPEEKNALDEWYIRHVSLLLDAKILFRTAWIIFAGDTLHDGAVQVAMDEARTLARVDQIVR